MDMIDKHLATATLNNKYEPSIQAALAVGKNLLNKYYNMTDHSKLYCIAMSMSIYLLNLIGYMLDVVIQVLHPSHKLDYFKLVDWEDKWVKVAEDIIRMEFEWVYTGLQDHNENNETDLVCQLPT